MGLELSMMWLAFLKNSLNNKKRVCRGGARCDSCLINKKWACSGNTKYNSSLINKKWVRSGGTISAIWSGHIGTPDLKKKNYKP